MRQKATDCYNFRQISHFTNILQLNIRVDKGRATHYKKIESTGADAKNPVGTV